MASFEKVTLDHCNFIILQKEWSKSGKEKILEMYGKHSSNLPEIPLGLRISNAEPLQEMPP